MFSRISRSIYAFPQVQIMLKQGEFFAKALAPMASWGIPLGAGVLWFAFPAIDDDFKSSLGFARSTPLPPAGVQYQYDEDSDCGDSMPIVRG